MTQCFLHELASEGDWRQMEILFRVKEAEDINERDNDFEGQTPLHWAIRKGHLRCVKVLLKHGADPSLRMHQGWTPAHCAAEIGHLEILKVLHEVSANLTARDNYGATPKDIAAIYGFHKCFEFLSNVQSAVSSVPYGGSTTCYHGETIHCVNCGVSCMQLLKRLLQLNPSEKKARRYIFDTFLSSLKSSRT